MWAMPDEKPPAEICKGVNGVDKAVLREDNRRSAEGGCRTSVAPVVGTWKPYQFKLDPKTDPSHHVRLSLASRTPRAASSHGRTQRPNGSASIERTEEAPPKDSREPSYCHVGRSPQALTKYFQQARVKGGGEGWGWGGGKRKIASPLYRSTDRSQFKSLRERTREGRDEAREVELDSSRSKRSPSSAGVFPVGDDVPACIAPSQAVGIEDMFNSL
ncbi:hypothetical protein C4D60_Mb03t04950 [Musa balbisiana]|uniref:Uncharacterized protein n=1 Tax=Musa balbisiana TaxID=52838 RepID=A0A4S8J7K8_MUSBA|nr:hypothetical protein C4D60_Mb03t04950 [Musa balbisiana]